ncbi:hypothetical protein K458DRAFT_363507 [Lentithecium fluviatile CBS 122367]|uniref:Uncharacterized protein n=1 Tax=Lentithecium fluviatile CBS 122367 TaxID=1168545 RepID=A0A6G1J643_9PLEO|nr:hypothetical protein K458DRAFT_363507 [Lentithecium fluviatile CBS 122367]
MPALHSRRPSGQLHQPARPLDTQTTSPPKHQRTLTAPDTPSLLRLPPASSAASARSPTVRRPPASFSGHGIDTSRGPPITLITRGNSDIARRSSQQPADFAYAAQQFAQLGLVSPGGASRSSRPASQRRDDADDADDASEAAHPTTQTNTTTTTPTLSRHNSTRTPRRPPHMASSGEGSSDYDSGMRSYSDMTLVNNGRGATDTSAAEGGGHDADLFLHIAEDSASRAAAADSAARSDRLRSRIARTTNRQSFPSGLHASPSQSSPVTPNASRIPSAIDTKASSQYRRASLLPSSTRSTREQSPLTPANPLETPRLRVQELSPKPSFSSRTKDAELSPKDFLAQLEVGRRRPSYPDATPPNRNGAYRPSNLHYYSSSRDNTRTAQVETPQEPATRVDGTESHGSTGPATSVWDELDELKTRIRRIELGGKIPATSGAAVSQAIADRPRTANTSITTASSSPHQQRKPNPSPSESTVGAPMPHKIHPLLGEALAKAKQHTSPAIYRVLEATASEALTLAEMTGSAGPQGTLQSASSILNGTSMPDRQVRRKADNICRSLTELCIALCDNKPSISSPAVRTTTNIPSRRPSVQINGESPSVRQSIEPESNTLPRSSPSSAMSRIEARRVSMLAGGARAYGNARESSQEPSTPSQSNIPMHLNRSGTSLFQSRRTANDDDDDPTLRAPSRAMTDFRATRTTPKTQFGREYTSREPMPDLQPSPAIQPSTSLRRPTVSGLANENLLFKDNSRRYGLDRQGSVEAAPKTKYNTNRNSMGSFSSLGRSVSLSRRTRGTSAGE